MPVYQKDEAYPVASGNLPPCQRYTPARAFGVRQPRPRRTGCARGGLTAEVLQNQGHPDRVHSGRPD